MINRLSDRSWIIRTFVDALKAEPPAPLDKWVDSGALMLPNNTAEPGAIPWNAHHTKGRYWNASHPKALCRKSRYAQVLK